MNRQVQFYSYASHGITQSVLKTWLSCRRKSELSLEGWSSSKQSYALIYGTIVHGVLERIYRLIQKEGITKIPSDDLIKRTVKRVEKEWLKENPTKDYMTLEVLDECCLMAEVILPEYFKFWWKKEYKKIEWKNLEQEFKIPYITKKGDKTFIRGKKDGVYALAKSAIKKAVKLFETKTKSQVNVAKLIEILWFEFQVNLYFWAIKKTYGVHPAGVTYNIIRKTSLKRKANESKLDYGKRLRKDVASRPEFYFIRLEISVSEKDMKIFENELEGMVQEFIDWRKGKLVTYKNTSSCEDKYGMCPYVEVCSKKDYSNLVKRKVVFKELIDL